jgi:asparagine synthase (glutamine-hydrolysing)
MGALVAAVNKTGEDVVNQVAAMLKELTHRGRDGCGIATPHQAKTAKSVQELTRRTCSSNVALGHNLSRILPRDELQPIKGHDLAVVFEGRLFPYNKIPETTEVIQKLGCNPLKNASGIIENLEGSYVFAVLASEKIVVGRDISGTVPLYYGENKAVCAVASERKALWKAGISEAKSFPPGHLAVMNKRGFSFMLVKALRKPPTGETVNMESAATALQVLLEEATMKMCADVDGVAVAFSGGVDSSVIAALAKKIGLNVQLVSVGLEDQPELGFAEEAAEALDLPLHLQSYSVGYLEESLNRVLWLIEEPHTVKAGIAVPFFWTAENASKLGCPVVLAGQGADELFGGYQKYVTEYKEAGAEALKKLMFHDVKNSYQTNFQRDNQVCSYFGVELRLPFVDPDVIHFSLRMPLQLKINSVEDKLRKRVLRRVAQNLRIPAFIANKPKKAVQYTSGVNKALQKLAKENNLTLPEYVKKIFNSIFGTNNISL